MRVLVRIIQRTKIHGMLMSETSEFKTETTVQDPPQSTAERLFNVEKELNELLNLRVHIEVMP